MIKKLYCPECGRCDMLTLEEVITRQTHFEGMDEDNEPVVSGTSVEIDSEDLDYPLECECGFFGHFEDFKETQ